LAGLGELSRIGELVLNPFVGPRFKSVVLTTNLPLVVDQPVDFGLQTFCENCRKCARECPVNAIPFGDKVFFNGYEIWKPDVERCTRYRVTNPKGSACGRCMKTCPLNKVVHADGPMLHRVGSWLGINARWLKPLLVPAAVSWDDSLGFGRRNPIKRWWQDLEIVDGVAQTPTATNERDLNLNADVSGAKSPVGYYYAADMPPGNSPDPYPVNHKQAVARADLIESVSEARSRRAAKKRKPDHYIPTRALD
ncbi:MAG: 4Fe-4S dicluster domain-containing protein, partial [Pseudomonadota bacterium]